MGMVFSYAKKSKVKAAECSTLGGQLTHREGSRTYPIILSLSMEATVRKLVLLIRGSLTGGHSHLVLIN